MHTIYDKIREQTFRSIKTEAEGEPLPETKAVTLRLRSEYVALLDNLAESLSMTRQALLSDLVYDAVNEALEAYASVFDDPNAVITQMLSDAGFHPSNGYSKPEIK